MKLQTKNINFPILTKIEELLQINQLPLNDDNIINACIQILDETLIQKQDLYHLELLKIIYSKKKQISSEIFLNKLDKTLLKILESIVSKENLNVSYLRIIFKILIFLSSKNILKENLFFYFKIASSDALIKKKTIKIFKKYLVKKNDKIYDFIIETYKDGTENEKVSIGEILCIFNEYFFKHFYSKNLLDILVDENLKIKLERILKIMAKCCSKMTENDLNIYLETVYFAFGKIESNYEIIAILKEIFYKNHIFRIKKNVNIIEFDVKIFSIIENLLLKCSSRKEVNFLSELLEYLRYFYEPYFISTFIRLSSKFEDKPDLQTCILLRKFIKYIDFMKYYNIVNINTWIPVFRNISNKDISIFLEIYSKYSIESVFAIFPFFCNYCSDKKNILSKLISIIIENKILNNYILKGITNIIISHKNNLLNDLRLENNISKNESKHILEILNESKIFDFIFTFYKEKLENNLSLITSDMKECIKCLLNLKNIDFSKGLIEYINEYKQIENKFEDRQDFKKGPIENIDNSNQMKNNLKNIKNYFLNVSDRKDSIIFFYNDICPQKIEFAFFSNEKIISEIVLKNKILEISCLFTAVNLLSLFLEKIQCSHEFIGKILELCVENKNQKVKKICSNLLLQLINIKKIDLCICNYVQTNFENGKYKFLILSSLYFIGCNNCSLQNKENLLQIIYNEMNTNNKIKILNNLKQEWKIQLLENSIQQPDTLKISVIHNLLQNIILTDQLRNKILNFILEKNQSSISKITVEILVHLTNFNLEKESLNKIMNYISNNLQILISVNLKGMKVLVKNLLNNKVSLPSRIKNILSIFKKNKNTKRTASINKNNFIEIKEDLNRKNYNKNKFKVFENNKRFRKQNN
ncbi:hypothetical protein CWI39_0199p0010 [Hamiltosporidium magnivora]|uniref:Uncharacterized protein n=1 Tax=Hamiltosporidium magnivora TaxID=148818 RepID=A0A4Q9LJC8_9MICR|nr:hypothetical protein CWI39_0199p0010 [Hamiltosporidium magnivora]